MVPPAGRGVFAVQNSRRDNVSQEMGTRRLDRVQVCRRQKHVEQPLQGLFQVKVHKEGPVQEPCSRLELSERVGLAVDHVPQVLDVGERGFPLTRQDVAGEFTPVGRERQVERGGKDQKVV